MLKELTQTKITVQRDTSITRDHDGNPVWRVKRDENGQLVFKENLVGQHADATSPLRSTVTLFERIS